MEQIIVITGPTASGKTSLAIECAKKFNGEIISSDSMQIYKDLNIGTAKQTKEEQAQAKHYMIDEVEANDDFSVSDFVRKAKDYIKDIISRGKRPIIVGGTGLYIKSLIYPYSFCSSPKNDEIREKYKKILNENGCEYLHSLLISIDKTAGEKIHKNDTKRVIRALEICELTKNKKTALNNEEKNLQYDVIFVCLDIDRKKLYERIDNRVDKMFEDGLLFEVEDLLKQNKINKFCQSMQAIGYKELFDYFDGHKTLDETKELIKKHSRNYAKRQLTFIRGMHIGEWFNPLCEQEKIFDYIKNNLK